MSDAEVAEGDAEAVICSGEGMGTACSKELTLLNPERTGDKHISFRFDWVLSGMATQEMVYDFIGERVMRGVSDGFHGCVFAYGQTGSGKSHTIFGGEEDARGLVYRICEGIFAGLSGGPTTGDAPPVVTLSYLEIYNEQLRDLLRPVDGDAEATALEVRSHPRVGVFVEGLTPNLVKSPADVRKLIDFGNKIRVVGCTNMNAVSSRSHAVVTLNVERVIIGSDKDGRTVKTRAQLHCVDLAGSERMKHAGESAVRQKESKEINKSLLALSLMISRLAGTTDSKRKGSDEASSSYIPYRDSKLTHLLSESLMGNCKTAMLACAAPASSSFAMTESTARFAASAKKIKTKPKRNEELEGDLVGSLRKELDTLRSQLARSPADAAYRGDLEESIAAAGALQSGLGVTVDELQAQSLVLERARVQTLQSLGLSQMHMMVAWQRGSSVQTLANDDADPYLVNVCDDPLLSGCLTYSLPRGLTVTIGSSTSATIHIDGLGIQSEMCSLVTQQDGVEVTLTLVVQKSQLTPCGSPEQTNRSLGSSASESLLGDTLSPAATSGRRTSAPEGRSGSLFKTGIAQVFVNQEMVFEWKKLRPGDRLRIGRTHVFQLFVPRASTETALQDALEDIVNDVAGEDVPAQMLASDYASHLRERVGGTRATKVFEALQRLAPLVEEANELTEELRGGKAVALFFRAHVLTDVTSASEDPALTVALYRTELPDDGRAPSPQRRRKQRQDEEAAQAGSRLLLVWSEPKFRQRLENMRDLYLEVSNREMPWGQVSSDVDLWADEVGLATVGGSRPHDERPAELAQLVTELEHVRADIHSRSAALVAEHLVQKELARVRAERDRLACEVPAVEDRLRLASREAAAKEAAVSELERLRADLAAAKAALSGLAPSGLGPMARAMAQAQAGQTADPATDGRRNAAAPSSPGRVGGVRSAGAGVRFRTTGYVTVYRAADSWDEIGFLPAGREVIGACEPQEEEGYVMLPIADPRGAVMMDYLEALPGQAPLAAPAAPSPPRLTAAASSPVLRPAPLSGGSAAGTAAERRRKLEEARQKLSASRCQLLQDATQLQDSVAGCAEFAGLGPLSLQGMSSSASTPALSLVRASS